MSTPHREHRDPTGPEGKAIARIARVCDQLSLFGQEHNAQLILNDLEVLALALGFGPEDDKANQP